MKLKIFLEHQGIKAPEFARRIGVTENAVRFYMSGERFPQPHIMLRIEDVTQGIVSGSDMARTWVAFRERQMAAE